MTDRPLGLTDALLLSVVFIWGASFAVTKYTIGEMGPMAFTGVRFLLAPAFLWAIVLRRQGRPRLDRQEWRQLGILGIAGIGLYQPLWALGLERTTATNSALIIATAPLFALLFAWLRGQEGLSWRKVTGLVVALVGVAFIIGANPSQGLRGSIGDGLTLGAAALTALATVLAEPLVRRRDALLVTTVSLSLGALFLLPFSLPFALTVSWSGVSAAGWGGLLYSAFLAAGLAYVFWYRGAGELGPTRTSVYAYLIPIVAVLVAALTLGEPLTAAQGLGAVLVLGGVWLTRTAPRRLAAGPTGQAPARASGAARPLSGGEHHPRPGT